MTITIESHSNNRLNHLFNCIHCCYCHERKKRYKGSQKSNLQKK